MHVLLFVLSKWNCRAVWDVMLPGDGKLEFLLPSFFYLFHAQPSANYLHSLEEMEMRANGKP